MLPAIDNKMKVIRDLLLATLRQVDSKILLWAIFLFSGFDIRVDYDKFENRYE